MVCITNVNVNIFKKYNTQHFDCFILNAVDFLSSGHYCLISTNFTKQHFK